MISERELIIKVMLNCLTRASRSRHRPHRALEFRKARRHVEG